MEDQEYRFERKVPLSERSFQERRWVFKRKCEDGHDHRDDLDERDRDDYRDNEVIARVRYRDRRRRVGEAMIDKVPEEFAVQDTPNRRPNQVDGRRDGNEASPVVPDELAHSNGSVGSSR